MMALTFGLHTGKLRRVMNQPPLPDPFNTPPLAPSPMTGAPTGDGTGGIIPFKNPNALASYYIGLFSLIPVASYIMAPLAIALGIKGLKYAKTYPVVKGQAHAIVGIVCGTLWTLVYYGVLLLGLISWLARPR